MARDRAGLRAAGNLERDPRIGAAWDKRHLPTKTLLAYKQARFSQAGTIVGSRRTMSRFGRGARVQCREPASPKPERWSGAGALRPGLGEAPGPARGRLSQAGTMVRHTCSASRLGRSTPHAANQSLPRRDDVQIRARTVLAREKHRMRTGPISPKPRRWALFAAQRPCSGETPAFLPEKQAIRAQRPCLGEIRWRKIPAWESRREGPTPLPGKTSRPSPARIGRFLPSRDVVQKCGRFRAPAAKTLPSKDDGPLLRRKVLAWEKRRVQTGPISPEPGR